jgi:hypothetical protein
MEALDERVESDEHTWRDCIEIIVLRSSFEHVLDGCICTAHISQAEYDYSGESSGDC